MLNATQPICAFQEVTVDRLGERDEARTNPSNLITAFRKEIGNPHGSTAFRDSCLNAGSAKKKSAVHGKASASDVIRER